MRARTLITTVALSAIVVPFAWRAGAQAEPAAPAADSTAIVASDDHGASAAGDSTAEKTAPLPFVLSARGDLATRGRGRGQVIEPAGVVVDDFGRAYVSDAALHRIQRFDARGQWLGEAGSLGSDPGDLRRPGALALLGTLNVAVLDRENRRVQSYDLFGRLQGMLIDLQSEDLDRELGRIDPTDMASDRGGAVYIVDVDRDRLLVFDFSGRYVRTLGGYGARPGSFHGLRGVGTGPRGDVFTAERQNARVQRLDPGGRPITSWALAVTAGDGALPVASDSMRVAVADQDGGRLWMFDTEGRALAELAGLDRPSALAFAPDGDLLVALGGAGVVRRYRMAAPEDPAPAPRK